MKTYIIIISLVCSLCACSSPDKLILGSWISKQPIDSTGKSLSYSTLTFDKQGFKASTQPMKTVENSGTWAIKNEQIILYHRGHLGGKYKDSLSIIRLDKQVLEFSKYNKNRQTIDTFQFLKTNQ